MLEEDRLNTYLLRILDAIKRIEKYTRHGTSPSGHLDQKTIDACLMQLIHIGELVNKIFKIDSSCDFLPKEAIKLRNFATHDYIGINIAIVKRVIKKDLPEMKDNILTYLQTNHKTT